MDFQPGEESRLLDEGTLARTLRFARDGVRSVWLMFVQGVVNLAVAVVVADHDPAFMDGWVPAGIGEHGAAAFKGGIAFFLTLILVFLLTCLGFGVLVAPVRQRDALRQKVRDHLERKRSDSENEKADADAVKEAAMTLRAGRVALQTGETKGMWDVIEIVGELLSHGGAHREEIEREFERAGLGIPASNRPHVTEFLSKLPSSTIEMDEGVARWTPFGSRVHRYILEQLS